MKHVYRVRFESRYSGVRLWMEDTATVLGNGDASKVVEIVRRRELRRSFEDVTKRGKIVTRRAIAFRMIGVERIAQVDY